MGMTLIGGILSSYSAGVRFINNAFLRSNGVYAHPSTPPLLALNRSILSANEKHKGENVDCNCRNVCRFASICASVRRRCAGSAGAPLRGALASGPDAIRCGEGFAEDDSAAAWPLFAAMGRVGSGRPDCPMGDGDITYQIRISQPTTYSTPKRASPSRANSVLARRSQARAPPGASVQKRSRKPQIVQWPVISAKSAYHQTAWLVIANCFNEASTASAAPCTVRSI